ncbi:MAG: succinate dehydrogenase cytochrome b subunit [Bacteroidota bacterium]
MSLTKEIFTSSIGRKVAMALSAFFLMFFLLQHLTINLTSVFSAELFNQLSHFMGTNPVVQFLLQPVLMFGVIFHFVMGFILELKNNKARVVKYAKNNSAANSSWFSRNMIWSGLFILFFMLFHFKDFWVPEMIYKYVEFKPEDPNRYYAEVVHMFESPLRVGVYVLAFVFLTLHLLHGFSSAFQSVGANNKYTEGLKKVGVAYAVLVPLGFIFIALFHFVSNAG